ncbi:MAG: CopD family protein [Gammaproteobacteria bacterium]|nr:CopD family protein [Gammaproteobacteria bacterium]MDH3767373.1 CopD family protein [Gammaproteobacteria bacterium]
MLWIKAFHIIFMVTWFAGLFYLPRLFVYHTQTTDSAGHERFCVMELRLFAIMTIGGVLNLVFGLWLLSLLPGLLSIGWFQIKLAIVFLLIAYHAWCYAIIKNFRDGNNRHSETWYRWFNEAPTLGLIATILLAVLKPF